MNYPAVILVVGAQGSGKTTLVKKFCEQFKKKSYKIFVSSDELPGKVFLPFEPPITTNSLVVVDDATGIFSVSGAGKNEWLRQITTKRHSNNTYIFVFHSLSRVPSYLGSFADWLFLFQTKKNDYNDNLGVMPLSADTPTYYFAKISLK